MALPSDIFLTWLLFFIYCVIGYVVECTYCSIPAGHFINRGFLNGPYLPIYGSGCILGVALFGETSNPVTIFLVGGALCCALEWMTSWTMEKLYHARWWDYSDKPLNFQGRFWIGGFIEFGLGLDLVVLLINPPILEFLEGLPKTTAIVLAVVTGIIMGADLVVTHIGAVKVRDQMDQLMAETRERAESARAEAKARAQERRAKADQRMQERLARREEWERALEWQLGEGLRLAREKAKERRPDLPQLPIIEKAGENFRTRLGWQERRMLKAFPTMRPSSYRELARDIADSYQEDEA